jgi:hypothetical protein
MPSQEGGALDKLAQPQSGKAITHRIVNRNHILLASPSRPLRSTLRPLSLLSAMIAFGQAR